MTAFIRTRFYDLSEDADIMVEFEEFTRDHERAELESFAYDHDIDYDVLNNIMTDYIFNGGISDEAIRKHLLPYHLGLLKITKLTNEIKQCISQTYMKYKAEGE